MIILLAGIITSSHEDVDAHMRTLFPRPRQETFEWCVRVGENAIYSIYILTGPHGDGKPFPHCIPRHIPWLILSSSLPLFSGSLSRLSLFVKGPSYILDLSRTSLLQSPLSPPSFFSFLHLSLDLPSHTRFHPRVSWSVIRGGGVLLSKRHIGDHYCR